MPTRARRILAEQRHKAQLRSSVGAFVMGVIYWITPKSPLFVVLLLVLTFAVSVPLALHGYVYRPTRCALAAFLMLHALLITVVGFAVWPRLCITPRVATFANKGEMREFRLENELSSERYNVDVVFHLEGDDPMSTLGLSIQGVPDKALSTGEPLPGLLGFIAQTPRGEIVLVATLDYLEPHEKRRITFQYRGDKSTVLRAEEPISWAAGQADSISQVDQHHWQSSLTAHLPDGYRVLRPIIVNHMGELSR